MVGIRKEKGGEGRIMLWRFINVPSPSSPACLLTLLNPTPEYRIVLCLQHLLSPGHTLEEANLLDGQLVLLEISQQDGAWPRSQLQSMFEAEEEEAQAGTAVGSVCVRVRLVLCTWALCSLRGLGVGVHMCLCGSMQISVGVVVELYFIFLLFFVMVVLVLVLV